MENYLHHWTLTECSPDYETVFLKNFTTPAPGYCFADVEAKMDPMWSQVQTYCKSVSLVWAVGGDVIQDFPQNLAYPMGGPSGFKYFFLQIHYNNPALTPSI
jgi:hypothetical protein